MKTKGLSKVKIPSYLALLIIILVASFFAFAIVLKIQDNAKRLQNSIELDY
jgi:predicted neutral ceramidase superfamily lipid hydrolase